ncbi:MAG: IS200/IS605 family transposase [Elusimicrobiota bacterium]
MEMKLIKSSHAVGESNFHIQLTPAYRRDIFEDENIAELTLAYILEKLNELKVVILGYGFGPDHLHLFLANVRFVSEVELVRKLKGYSSYKMRKHFSYLFKTKLYGKKFWSEGHFYRSVRTVNAETMKHYVEESQEKHWEKTSFEKKEVIVLQRRINEF